VIYAFAPVILQPQVFLSGTFPHGEHEPVIRVFSVIRMPYRAVPVLYQFLGDFGHFSIHIDNNLIVVFISYFHHLHQYLDNDNSMICAVSLSGWGRVAISHNYIACLF
jgi:hypothetical protein